MNRWLDMALYKALIIIGKAVNLDNLTTVDSLVKHSSSAVDTVGVFYSVIKKYLLTYWKFKKIIKLIDLIIETITDTL